MTRHFGRVAIPAAALMSASAAFAAQAPAINAGNLLMQGSNIHAYDNVWLVTLHYNDGRVVERGLSTDHVRPIEVNGKRYLSRIESEAGVSALPGQPPTSTSSSTFNIFDGITLAPLHGESRSSDGDSMVREFDGRRVVTRTRDPGAVEQATTVTTAEPAFDFHGGMTGLLLAALPLKPGFHVRLAGIGDRDFDYSEIRVIRQELVAAGRLGKVRAWLVEIGPTPAHSIYWISKRAPYVIRAIVNSPRGYASWDMIR
jgi:hypothetical protein